MSLGKRIIQTGSPVVCTTETTDKFGDSSGVLLYSMDYDASDSSGTSDGTPTDVTFGVAGQINTAARFNGSSSFINTNYTLTTDTTFSFSWWMNAETATTNHYIMNDGNGTGHDGSFAIYHNTSGQLGMWIGANGSGYAFGLLTISGGLTGSLMHFAVSVNGSTVTVYKNGSSAGTITLTPHSTAGILTLVIGRLGHFNGFHFKGELDQVRYFSKAISSDEVTALYNETACIHSATTTNIDFPTTNLAYYKMDNSAEDSHSGTYDATPTEIEYRFGKYGQAAVFASDSSFFNTGLTDSNLGTTYSVSLWAYADSLASSGDYYSIVGKYSTGSGNLGYILSANPSGVINFFGYFGNQNSTATSLNSLVTFKAGKYHHIVLVIDGSSEVRLYVDNQKATQSISSTINQNSVNLMIGSADARTAVQRNFIGNIDQVRVFPTALIDSQVTQLFDEKAETDTNNFKAVLYEGNASTNYISNVGIDLETNGGFVWTKSRTDAFNHMLYDSVRGATNYLKSNSASQSQTNANTLMSFEANGFFLGASDNSNYTSGGDGVSWVWKGGGTAVTNGDGSVSSSVSANPSAGFSIVKWAGDGTTSQTVGHGLSSAPELVIMKDVTGGNPWYVLTTAYSAINPAYLVLNTTAQAISATFTSTATTFTNFAYGSDVVAWCFHSVAGYSKIGTYSGTNSSGNTAITGLGFTPSFFMAKRVDVSGNSWTILDDKRVESNGNLSELFADTASAESGSGYDVDFVSGGITINSTSSNLNASGTNNYLYMAFK